MNASETFVYKNFKGLELKSSYYQATTNVKNHVLLYFHGGGLVYGTRDDLPANHLQTLLENGYHVLTFDYPLAPETGLPEIYECVKEAVQWFQENSQEKFSVSKEAFSLFGRSAGAYLVYLLARDSEVPNPEKVIAFYGYDSLLYEEFTKPSTYYKKFPSMPKAILDRMIGDTPVAHGPIQTRFTLYLHARQSGEWMNFLGVDKKEAEKFSLTDEELSSLPPVFIAHSDADEDVPYKIGKKLSEKIPKSYFHEVKVMEHDFDREAEAPQTIQVYQKLIDWLSDSVFHSA